MLGSCNNKSLVATKVYVQYPYSVNDTTISDFKDSFSITSYKDAMLYLFPVEEFYITDNNLDSIKEHLEYFIYKINSGTGLLFDSLNDQYPHTVVVDSMIRKRGLGSISYDSLSFDLQILKSTKISEDIIKETALMQYSVEGPDTVYLSYNKNFN